MAEDRRKALREALGYEPEEEPSEGEEEEVRLRPHINMRLRRGPVYGRGVLRTRLNWGTVLLGVGVILFIIWMVLKAKQEAALNASMLQALLNLL